MHLMALKLNLSIDIMSTHFVIEQLHLLSVSHAVHISYIRINTHTICMSILIHIYCFNISILILIQYI